MNAFPIRTFFANGVFGDRSYRLEFSDSATPISIIVGPNGTGKSTIISLYYLFITRQWERLSKLDFSDVGVVLRNGEEVSIDSSLLMLSDELRSFPPSINRYISRLRASGHMSVLASSAPISRKQLSVISREAGVPVSMINQIQNITKHEPNFFGTALMGVEEKLEALRLGTVLYLPTFRRIEKAISISHDDESNLEKRTDFIELVKSGMGDVSKLIKNYVSEINGESRRRTSRASQEFIRDMVQGKVSEFSLSALKDQDSNSIRNFIMSMDDELLANDDKERLLQFIRKEQTRKSGKPKKDDQYMGYFVSKMLKVFEETQALEQPIHIFLKLVSRYFSPTKLPDYDSTDVQIYDSEHERSISLEDLSSGEKQIFAVFAYLLFSGRERFIVLIDEPELSLSVPWQRYFLPDIVGTGKCAQLVAVTHSPFTFDNEMEKFVEDAEGLYVND